jgi:hypothetical protein
MIEKIVEAADFAFDTDGALEIAIPEPSAATKRVYTPI